MFAIVRLSNHNPEAPNVLGVDLEVIGSWGNILTDHISQDVSSATPTQAVNALKTKVVNWAASSSGGGIALTPGQVWIFGGIQ